MTSKIDPFIIDFCNGVLSSKPAEDNKEKTSYYKTCCATFCMRDCCQREDEDNEEHFCAKEEDCFVAPSEGILIDLNGVLVEPQEEDKVNKTESSVVNDKV